MQNTLFRINYGNAVSTLPARAFDFIISGRATPNDIKTLIVACSLPPDSANISVLAEKTGMDPDSVIRSVGFWENVGIVTFTVADSEDTVKSGSDSRKKADITAAGLTESRDNPAATEPVTASETTAEKPGKILLSEEMPKYSGSEISAIISRGGEKTSKMLETCQQLIGHLFSPTETSTVIGLQEWLGLDADYIVTLFAYYVEKKPRCNVRYIEKVAVDLVNKGITELASLDSYFKNLEVYDSLSGKLRTLAGIGGRTFTNKENQYINQWISMGFNFDMIKAAYEQSCDNTGKFNFSYANTVLENWHKSGIRTPDDAEKEKNNFKAKSKASKGSFETDRFFSLALKKSYDKMSGK